MESIQKKIILDEYGKRIADEYCADEMKKLKRICDPIILKKGVPQMYHDDLYSAALATLIDSIVRYDKSSECSFKTFLTGNIKRTFYDWTRDSRRFKRCNAKKDDNGELVIIPDIYIDAPTEDGIDICEKIDSGFRIEDELSEEIGFSLPNNVQDYLKSLGEIERQIAELVIQGYSLSDIRDELNIGRKEFAAYIADMRDYEKKKNLIREENNCPEEDNFMENITTTSEKKKDTSYSLAAISKKLRKHQLKDDHVLQRASGQWSQITKSELISDILQGNALTQIIISEEVKNGITMHWLIDGKQRCTNIDSYLDNGFAISKNVQVYNISYQTDKLDKDGNIIYNEEGFPIPDIKTFDIRNKKFSQLPEELQDKFNEYQLPVMLNLNCTKKDIAYDIARFNRCRPMNVAQNGWTGLEETFAEYVDNILKMDFFKIDSPKTNYTKANATSGAKRRMIVEAIITSRYIDNYDRDFRKMCEYLTEEASEAVFIDFYTVIERLSGVVGEETKILFNMKNSYLWIALFDKFIDFNKSDDRFGEFIKQFSTELHKEKVNGITYDELDKNGNTKDKTMTKKKMKHLITLLKDFLHIETEDTSETEEINIKSNMDEPISVIDFVKENVKPDVDETDIECYEQDFWKYSEKIEGESPLLDEENEPSLVAVVAYACQTEVDTILQDWFVEFFKKNNTYIKDQKENYINMKSDLNRFIQLNENIQQNERMVAAG